VLIKASYVAEEANIEAGFAGIFGKITSAYFQRYGDKSDALAKIAVKAHKNGSKNPFAHFPEGVRLRILPQSVGQESVCRRTAEAHRLLAGDRWCGPRSC
jgi:acetyl-CoA acetyltransferase